MKKKILFATLMMLPLLAGCNKNTTVIHPLDEFLKMDTEFKAEGSYKIGILKPATIPALDACEDGFVAQLAKDGWVSGTNITYTIQNAGGDASKLTMFADNLISDCDLVLGISTGSTQALKSSQFNIGSKKPILFAAVTDAKAASLINTNEVPGGYVTGASDAQPVGEQINLMRECIPTISKIGVIYTVTEDNSRVQALDATKAIRDAGLTPEVTTCTDQNDVESAVSSLVAKGVQGIYVPTDNNIAANITKVKNICNQNGVLLCAGEEGMVAGGAHVSLSIDYNELGKAVGAMANRILRGGVSPNMIPVVTMNKESMTYVMNSSSITDAGITLSPEVLQKQWKDVSEE